MSKNNNQESGFTGLEAAIILIAFVIVASIFAYTTLESGFFATDKAQVTTATSMKEASSAVYLEGTVYGTLSSGNQRLHTVDFTLAVPDTGMDQDLQGMIISYTQREEPLPRTYVWGGDLTTATTGRFGVENAIKVLKPGEKAVFRLSDVNGPLDGEWFTIDIKPKNGASFLLTRWLPRAYTGGAII